MFREQSIAAPKVMGLARPPRPAKRRRPPRFVASLVVGWVGFAVLGGLGVGCDDQVVVEGAPPPSAAPGPSGQDSSPCRLCNISGIEGVLFTGQSFCPEEQVKFDALIACACRADTCGANTPGATGRGDNCWGFEENPDDGLGLLCEPNGWTFVDGSGQCSDCLFAFCAEEAEACRVF